MDTMGEYQCTKCGETVMLLFGGMLIAETWRLIVVGAAETLIGSEDSVVLGL